MNEPWRGPLPLPLGSLKHLEKSLWNNSCHPPSDFRDMLALLMSVFWSLECSSLFACSVSILQEWCLCIISDKCFWLPMNKGFSSFLSQALHQAYLPSQFDWAQWLCSGKSSSALCLHRRKLRKQEDHPNFPWSWDIPSSFLYLFVLFSQMLLFYIFCC